MNLQSSSNVSMVSGSSGVDSSQNLSGVISVTPQSAQVGTEGNVAEVFTNALMQQLELLKQATLAGQVQPATTQTNLVQNPVLPMTNPVLNSTVVAVPVVTATLPQETGQSVLLAMQQAAEPQLTSSSPMQATQTPTSDIITSGLQQTLADNVQQLNNMLSKLENNAQSAATRELNASSVQDMVQKTQDLLQQIQNILQSSTANSAVLNSQQLVQDAAQQVTTLLEQAGISVKTLPQLPSSMQEISANSGKQLPTTKKSNSTTELQDTLQTLADVMAQINVAVTQLQVKQQVVDTKASADQALSVSASGPDAINLALSNHMQLIVTQASVAGAPQENTVAVNSSNNVVQENHTPAISKWLPESATNVQATATPVPQTAQPAAYATILSGIGTHDGVSNPVKADISSKADLQNLGALSAMQNAATDVTPKDMINRGATEMLQLGQQFASDNKVSVPGMTKHVYSSEWSQELGSKIAWMTGQNISAADIKLNPEHLGPISIRIDMHQDQANISFTALNSGVKELLEASIPKLREMLGAQQLNLADVNVSQNSFSGQGQAPAQNFGQGHGEHKQSQSSQDGSNELVGQPEVLDDVTSHIEQSRAIVTNGLVSYYA